MTLRRRIAERAEFAARLIETAAYIAAHPELDEIFEDAGPIQLTFAVRSKAEADEVIEAYGARPFWRNGLYMAEWKPGPLEDDEEGKLVSRLMSKLLQGVDGVLVDEAEFEFAAFELHFAPPITIPDVA